MNLFGRCSLWLVLVLGAGCAEERKSYMRNPLVREMRVTIAPASVPEVATPVEPLPPPRPILPIEPSSLATAPTIKSLESTPVSRPSESSPK